MKSIFVVNIIGQKFLWVLVLVAAVGPAMAGETKPVENVGHLRDNNKEKVVRMVGPFRGDNSGDFLPAVRGATPEIQKAITWYTGYDAKDANPEQRDRFREVKYRGVYDLEFNLLTLDFIEPVIPDESVLVRKSTNFPEVYRVLRGRKCQQFTPMTGVVGRWMREGTSGSGSLEVYWGYVETLPSGPNFIVEHFGDVTAADQIIDIVYTAKLKSDKGFADKKIGRLAAAVANFKEVVKQCDRVLASVPDHADAKELKRVALFELQKLVPLVPPHPKVE